jgi:hypothetical protein
MVELFHGNIHKYCFPSLHTGQKPSTGGWGVTINRHKRTCQVITANMSTIVNKLIQTIQNVNIQPHSKGEISRQKGNLTKVYDRYDRKNARQQNSIL